MLAELMANAGKAILGDIPPDGAAHWAKRGFWDRDGDEGHPLIAGQLLKQKATLVDLLDRHGSEVEKAYEFCCGTGEITRLVADHTPVKELVGLDIGERALRMARKRVNHDNLRLIHGDFWDDHGLGTADLVVCVDAIHHLGDTREVLESLRSYVRPGGLFLGNFWTGDHWHEFQRLRHGELKHLLGAAAFLGTAMLIRASGGRLATGAYRTQLRSSAEVEGLLYRVFPQVVELRAERYFTAFVCRG
ncbi:class I SAM-dependent methyltransferase [Nonomuraea sp. NPDC049158]|uniref:class I SAM-dependent methyltransferase n=1 Tax=Nonomuraea sp. NPDC049158 TaxID=3155649 RepID=UPI00340BF7AF